MKTKPNQTLLAAFVATLGLLPVTVLNAKSESETREEIRIVVEEAKEAARIAAEEAREAVRSWSWTWDSDERASERGPEPYIGVTIESVPRALRRYVDLPKGIGLLLVKIHEDSPAKAAGLEDDDIMIEFNNQMIANFDQFSTLVDLLKEGDTVPVQVLRKGDRITVELTVEERIRKGNRWIPAPEAPAAPETPPTPGAPIGHLNSNAGHELQVETLTSRIPRSVRILSDEGGEITEIDLTLLKSNLGSLEKRLRHLKIERDGEELPVGELLKRLGEFDTVVVDSGEGATTQSILHMGETTLSLSNDVGKVRIFSEGGVRNALVTSDQGVVLYDGAIPADLSGSDMDPRARELIEALLKMSQEVEFDLESTESMPVELEISESKKLTRA